MKFIKNRNILLLFLLAIISLLITAALFYFGHLRFNYVGIEEYPVQGLDVSHHQGAIDWHTVKNSGFRFVFIKATEGGDWVDPQFRRNWEQARNNGFAVGAYHFFTFRKTGREQAGNFIRVVPEEDGTLPPVIDLEFMGNSRNRLSKLKLHEELSDFIRIVESRYRKKPVLYVTYEFYEYYLRGRVNDYPLWIRDVFGKPGLIDGRSWTFWQYANRARVDGIERYVDLNAFSGTIEEFHTFIMQAPE